MRLCTLLLALILLASCGAAGAQNGTPTAADGGDQVVAIWTRSGGFAGTHDVMTVYADGRVTLEQGQGSHEGQADATVVERLRQTFQSAEWKELEPRYGEQFPDAFQYTIESQGQTVQTFDGASNPPVLQDLLEQFNTIYQGVIQANQS
jgi:hypothetical protein